MESFSPIIVHYWNISGGAEENHITSQDVELM
jgi:hypothetical protein